MKNGITLILIVLLVFGVFPEIISAQEFNLQSDAALLLEPVTGEIIYSYNEEQQLYPASITKVMTMLLTMEAIETGKISLDDIVTVGPNAAAMGGSTIFLSQGDQLTIEELLIGMAVGSGNDAAVAIAEYTAGSEEQFVEQMNSRAKELGMEKTNFANSHGLHNEDHYTTASDIAVMSRELLKYENIHEWLTIWMDKHFLQGKINAGEVYLSNSNRLIRYYQGADGLKTGYTQEAGHCLVATAKRGDSRFISIVLNAPSSDVRYQESRMLLDYAFANYTVVPLAEEGESMGNAPVERGTARTVGIKAAEPLTIVVEKGGNAEFEQELCLQDNIKAPLAKGQVVGELVAMNGEKEEVARVPVITAQKVDKAGFLDYFRRLLFDWVRFGR